METEICWSFQARGQMNRDFVEVTEILEEFHLLERSLQPNSYNLSEKKNFSSAQSHRKWACWRSATHAILTRPTTDIIGGVTHAIHLQCNAYPTKRVTWLSTYFTSTCMQGHKLLNQSASHLLSSFCSVLDDQNAPDGSNVRPIFFLLLYLVVHRRSLIFFAL